MKPHLYILPFNDKQFLKVGISLTNNFNRINHLASIYDINYDNIILYSSDNINNIKLLEKNIKTIINETISPDNIHYGKDGHTEIRNVKHLNDINTIIDTFKPLLNLYELKYTKQTTPIKKEKKTIIDDIHNIDNIDNNIIIDNIIYTLTNIKQYITYIDMNNNILDIKLNLSSICKNDNDIDNILKPLFESIILKIKKVGVVKFKLCNGYKYNNTLDIIELKLSNNFNYHYELLSKNDYELQKKLIIFSLLHS
jgi:hypothetical protein